MQLLLDRPILEHLLARAATASRLVGQIDERAGGTIVGSLEDSIDEIVHVLSELLGNPHVVVAPVPSGSAFAVDVATPGDAGPQVVGLEVVALAAEVTPVSASSAGGAL